MMIVTDDRGCDYNITSNRLESSGGTKILNYVNHNFLANTMIVFLQV